jgi:Fe-S oxidoreductase
MCNNNGHCRKFDAGTMCPSFRVTRDEKHLTRGRANTLRLALSGNFGEDPAAPDVREALDLCVSCKGCRRECPTGVDMARMKIEFQHQWQKTHGLTRKERLIADLPRWAPWASRFAWLANLRNHWQWLAVLGERKYGISARRKLPSWRFDAFGAPDVPAQPIDDADVVLFVDTFTRYFEPENARAALRVLQAAGYRVSVAEAKQGEALCCGRTYLTAGLVDEARAHARRMIAALGPAVARGIPILGLEPSCLLSLRDEYLVMGLGDEAVRLAKHGMLIEEFLAREHEAGKLRLPLVALPQTRALLHGHCHQKAFDVMGPTTSVLRLVPNLTVEVVESSCCGMAGSFGYEAAHVDVSLAMAELALLPAVRKAAADTLIVADGTSCRHQIADGAARDAVHVVRVLERALQTSDGYAAPSASASRAGPPRLRS